MVATRRGQGAHQVQVDVGEMPLWDRDGGRLQVDMSVDLFLLAAEADPH